MKKQRKPRVPLVWWCLYDRDGFPWYHSKTLKQLRSRLEDLEQNYRKLAPWEIVKYVREVKRRRK